jgi:hypothetical protein
LIIIVSEENRSDNHSFWRQAEARFYKRTADGGASKKFIIEKREEKSERKKAFFGVKRMNAKGKLSKIFDNNTVVLIASILIAILIWFLVAYNVDTLVP